MLERIRMPMKEECLDFIKSGIKNHKTIRCVR